MSVTILATGDLHIGRRSSTKNAGFNSPEEISCASMWRRLVDCAIEKKVDLVLLSGDIVDQDNCYFEAIAPLEKGLRKLHSHGIQTYATAGNHDAGVLPRLARLVNTGSFQLLGKDGTWESVDYSKDGKVLARIHGWSFFSRHHQTSPLLQYELEAHPDVPTIGLLHADLDVPNSKYAPVTLDELQSKDLSIWVLGHQHKPLRKERPGSPTVLYPGSPQAMDPGEKGIHGPWLLQIDDRNDVTAEQLPLSTVRYDICNVNAEACTEADDLINAISRAAQEYEDGLQAEVNPPLLALLRFEIEGRSAISQQLESLPEFDPEKSELFSKPLCGRDTAVHAEKIVDKTLPLFDLRQLAEKKDPIGVVAGLLLGLEQDTPDPETDALIEDCISAMHKAHQVRAYLDINSDQKINRAEAREILKEQGLRLIAELQNQESAA